MSGLVYLASPYTHPDPAVVEARFQAVCLSAGEFMRAGEFIYSPIAHTHPIAMVSALPTGWEFWKGYDEAMISRCSEVRVLMLDGWRESAGVMAEIGIAECLGIPVTYVEAGVAVGEGKA